jgi:hypothetical protein
VRSAHAAVERRDRAREQGGAGDAGFVVEPHEAALFVALRGERSESGRWSLATR